MNAAPEYDDSTLLAYLDGEVDAPTAAAIAADPALQARTTALAAAAGALQRRLYRAVCPSSLALGEFGLGLLTGADRAAVDDHVRHCPLCSAELALSRRFLASSAALIDHLATGLRTVAAVLQGGAGPLPGLAYGLRGSDDGPRLYEAGDFQISIEVQDDGADRRALLGLLLGEHVDGWEAVLLNGDEVAATVALDDLGNFGFHALPAGEYALLLRGTALLIQIPPLIV